MNEIYTGIDLGTNSIKVVVCLKDKDKFQVLAAVSSKARGIKNGQILDTRSAVSSVKEAMKQVNAMLGIKVTKVIVAVPPENCSMSIVVGSCDVVDYENITGEDVRNVVKDALMGHIDSEHEVITATPISFTVDEMENIKDPKGMAGKTIEAKVVVSTLLKEPLYSILEVLKLSGLDTVDIAYTSTGDYFSVKCKEYDEEVGAIINIGEKSTNISVFNKGIQIKNAVVPIGSVNVDKDLSYVFKIGPEDARKIKENFAVCSSSYADNNDYFECMTIAGEKKELSQVGVSKVVESRVAEILKIAKNEIKNLTKREIHYIIITGGLSELAGFQYLVEDMFGTEVRICNIPVIGIRHNKYSSVYGVTKYFDDKIRLRGKKISTMSENEFNYLVTKKEKATSENLVSKVFGHFFDN